MISACVPTRPTTTSETIDQVVDDVFAPWLGLIEAKNAR